MINPLFEMVAQYISISPALERDLVAMLHYEEVPRKHILLDLGQMGNKMYFIKKGLLRSFYYLDGEEITNWFLKENDIALSLLSFHRKLPSFEIIEALEDCELISWNYDDLNSLYAHHIEMNIVGRILTTEYHCQAEKRVIATRKHTAIERYMDLMENEPEIIKRAPNKDIATYLSMTEETLSRIKSGRR